MEVSGKLISMPCYNRCTRMLDFCWKRQSLIRRALAQENGCSLFAQSTEVIKALLGPKNEGKYLHKLVKEKLGNTRLHQTLTNVVISTFDIKNLQPTIFSSCQTYATQPLQHQLLYLPIIAKQQMTEGKLSILASCLLTHFVTFFGGSDYKENGTENSDFFPIKPMNYRDDFLLSRQGLAQERLKRNIVQIKQ
ncbi:hypothetical protein QQP08_023743 [Theobroma cacao]|nr:hypothetical protein QQP08_023743 [Theobroma cacao]